MEHDKSEEIIKIVEVTSRHVLFSDRSEISYHHEQDCCEVNYADFSQLEEAAYGYEFHKELRFEVVPRAGFRFGDKRRMFFVPCYSDQNGYYSDSIEILYRGWKVLPTYGVGLEFPCEDRFEW